MTPETVHVLSPTGDTRGTYEFVRSEPWFFTTVSTLANHKEINVDRGDRIQLQSDSGVVELRNVVGVTIDNMVGLRILAPKTITKPNPDADYIRFSGIELRAGTSIVGGRDSGFYDGDGLIVHASHVGGDPERYEDWAYYVIGKSNYRQNASQWITLDNIGFATAEPSALFDFETPQSDDIDSLITQGDNELIKYLAQHPTKFDILTGKQFEAVMVAIYKNLGFEVESVGRWNQADGGVDIIAISKTSASIDYRLAIQCKASKNKISAKPIRELAGVLDKFQAHQGIVATTSRFTGPARKESEGHLWRLALQDRDAILRRLMSIVRPEFKQFIDMLEASK